MAWQVILCDEFEPEFDALPSPLQDELLAHLKVLEAKGPMLAGRWWTRSRGAP